MDRQRKKLAENMIEDDVVIFDDAAFCDSLIATTDDDRAVYDFDVMVEEYSKFHGISQDEAADYISYNLVRFASNMGGNAPIIIYPLR